MFIPHSHYIEILAIYHKLDSEKLTIYFNLIDFDEKEKQLHQLREKDTP